jgi:serine/threonine protein kinase
MAQTEVSTSLLELAAEAVGPMVAGCAGLLLGPMGVAVGAAMQAVNRFGPPIVEKWLGWLQQQPEAEQQQALAELGSLALDQAQHQASALINRAAPQASAQDKEAAANFLTAIPLTVQRALVHDQTGRKTLLPSLSPTSGSSLLQLLPLHLLPYPVGATVPGTPYRLEQLLGMGGFGTVYRASASGLQHLPLAIKFCRDASLANALKQERSILERMIAADPGSWSPLVVRLYGHQLDHPTPFLVYEYVDGGNLADLVLSQASGKGLSPRTALHLVTQIAQALHFAHRQGLVHRDLKPSNVLLTRSRDIKLVDFGIGGAVVHQLTERSRATTGQPQATTADQVSLLRGAGTPLYMSEEQRLGKSADPRQDVYSLGVLWYQLLTGDVSRAMYPHWATDLAERGVPKEHIAVLGQCVEAFKKRPAHAGEVLAWLEALREKPPVAVPVAPPTPPQGKSDGPPGGPHKLSPAAIKLILSGLVAVPVLLIMLCAGVLGLWPKARETVFGRPSTSQRPAGGPEKPGMGDGVLK